MSYDNQYYDDDQDQIVAPAPGFDLTVLSQQSQKQIMRQNEKDMTDAIISAARANSRSKVAMVAAVSQAQLEETVTMLMKRNPRPGAVQNLQLLARANTEYLMRLLLDEDRR